MKITAIGELLIDFAPLQSDDAFPSFKALPGGAPCNFLAACKANGATASFIGKVGNDAFGRMLISVLEEKGINTQGIVCDDGVFTTLAFVTLDSSGDRSFSFARKPGADTCLRYEEIKTELIDECDVFHFGTLSFTDEPSASATVKALEYAKNKGKTISFDPNYRDKLWKNPEDAKRAILKGLGYADIVKISEDETDFVFSLPPVDAARKIIKEFGVSVVAVTCGKIGAYYVTDRFSGFVPNYESVTTVDTTGAGDIFGGFFVTSLLSYGNDISLFTENEVKKACLFACTAASLSTEKHGGISSVPALSCVLKILENND